jgi:hypothetical protein
LIEIARPLFRLLAGLPVDVPFAVGVRGVMPRVAETGRPVPLTGIVRRLVPVVAETWRLAPVALIGVCVAAVGAVPVCATRAVVMKAVVMRARIVKAGTTRCRPTPIRPASSRPDESARMESAHAAAMNTTMRTSAAPGHGVAPGKECPDEDSSGGGDDNLADHDSSICLSRVRLVSPLKYSHSMDAQTGNIANQTSNVG